MTGSRRPRGADDRERRTEPGERADQRAAGDRQAEQPGRLKRPDTSRHRGDRDREGDEGGAVIEEALRVHDGDQPPRRPQLRERRDDGGRIGG